MQATTSKNTSQNPPTYRDEDLSGKVQILILSDFSLFFINFPFLISFSTYFVCEVQWA